MNDGEGTLRITYGTTKRKVEENRESWEHTVNRSIVMIVSELIFELLFQMKLRNA